MLDVFNEVRVLQSTYIYCHVSSYVLRVYFLILCSYKVDKTDTQKVLCYCHYAGHSAVDS